MGSIPITRSNTRDDRRLRKTLKIAALALGVLVLAFVALAIALVLIVNPNDYKDDIVQAVKTHTGRELKIDGDLRLSFFPRIGLALPRVELGNAPGFGKEPFARLASATVSVEILPLLRQQLNVARVDIDGLRVALERNRAGKTNWQDLVAAPAAPAQPTPPPAGPGAAASAPAALAIGAVRLRNGEIRWQDQQAGTRYVVHDLELSSDKIELGRPVDLRMRFALEGATPPERLPVGLELRAQLDAQQQNLDVSRLELSAGEFALNASLQARGIDRAPVIKGRLEVPPFNPRALMKTLGVSFTPASGEALRKLSLKTDFTVDLGQQAFSAPHLALAVDGIALSGALHGSELVRAPKLRGDFELADFRPAELLDLLAVPYRKPLGQVFARGELRATFSAEVQQRNLEVASLSLVADDLRLTGNFVGRDLGRTSSFSGHVSIPALDPRALLTRLGASTAAVGPTAVRRVALKSDFAGSAQQLVLDGLDLKLDDTTASGKVALRNLADPAYTFALKLDQIDLDRYLPPPAPSAAPATPGGAGGAAPAPAAGIPLEALRALDLQGELAVGKLKAFGLRSTDVLIKLAAKNGFVTIGPSTAKLYDGSYQGKTVVDARGQTPKFTIQERLGRVKVGPLLGDAGISDQLTGTGDLNLDLTARGLEPDAVRKTLSGTLFVDLNDGEVKGIDLQKMVNDLLARVEQLKNERPSIKPKPTESTKYDRFKATLKLNNGIASNDDLDLRGPLLLAGKKQGGIWVTGKGTADLTKETLNYRLNVRAAEDVKRKGTTLPVDVAGTFAEPVFRPDLGEFLRAEVQKKVDQRKEEQKQVLDQKKEEKKKELEDDLKEKLRKRLSR